MRKKLIIVITIFLSCICYSTAQNNLDKEISKISRDTKNYISAEVRASSEDEAYEEALKQLTVQVADYYRSIGKQEIPEKVVLSNLSSRFERLITHNCENRYRVLVYVKKSDLIPADQNSLVLTKGDNASYQVVSPELSEPLVVTDTIVEVVKKIVPPSREVPDQIYQIVSESRSRDIKEILETLRKSNSVSGAALFPIGKFGDFYVAIVNNSNHLETILYFDGNSWTEALNGTLVNPHVYSDSKAYWFTIPN